MGSSVLTAKAIDLNNSKNYPEELNSFESDEKDNIVKNKP